MLVKDKTDKGCGQDTVYRKVTNPKYHTKENKPEPEGGGGATDALPSARVAESVCHG